MKIRRITSLIAAAAFGVGIGAVVVTTSGASAAASTTVHVQEVATNATYVPVQQLLASKSQTNRGDYIAFNDRLYFPSTGTRAGTVEGDCVLTAPTASLFYCTVDFILSGKGRITAVGLFDATGKTTTTGAVTGGTGNYALARGTVRVRAISQTKNDFVFKIS